MDDKHSAANCRWAKPTLFLPLPFWLEAWDYPWTCTRDEIPRFRDDRAVCRLPALGTAPGRSAAAIFHPCSWRRRHDRP